MTDQVAEILAEESGLLINNYCRIDITGGQTPKEEWGSSCRTLLNECSLVLEPLLVVEEQVALAVQHLLDGRGHDLVVVATVPAVPVGGRGMQSGQNCKFLITAIYQSNNWDISPYIQDLDSTK